MSRVFVVTLTFLSCFLFACGSKPEDTATNNNPRPKETKKMSPQTSHDEIATLGAGCYWCIEAVLQQVEGVTKIESGFMGGHLNDPSYEDICRGTTGHAEVVQVHFDPSKIKYRELLGWFWKLHDPTTLNRQGNDVGTQYRSVIFYHSPEQKEIAEDSKMKVGKSGAFSDPIVTEITEASHFWKAKAEHQDYYRRKKNANPYCRYTITPKLKKLGLDY